MHVRALENYTIPLYDARDQFKRLVYDRSKEAFAAGDRARDEIRTLEQLAQRQQFVRERLLEGLGGLPAMDTPLNPRCVDTVRGDGYKVELIIFESRPQTYVTTNLYVPDGNALPRGAVLFLCGHFNEAKHHAEYQMVCQYLVRAGLVVLAMDPIGQGERLSYYESAAGENLVRFGTSEHDYAGAQCLPLGDGLARYFLHDAIRAVDYLCTRPEVDPARIGVTGNSGGGVQTALLMMSEPRLAAAAPATFIMSRGTYLEAGQTQDAEQIWPGLSAAGIDHEDALLCMVPRPVRVLAVEYDFFPIEGTRRTVARTKRFWTMFGKDDHLDLVEDQSGHAYTRTLAEAAVAFFTTHLLGREVEVAQETVVPIKPSSLWCTRSGQVRGDFPDSRAVYEDNCERLAYWHDYRMKLTDSERKDRAINWLRGRVFGGRKASPLNPRHMDRRQPDSYWMDLTVTSSVWWSQAGLFNHAYTFSHYRNQEGPLPVTIAVWDKGTTELQRHQDWIRETCGSGRMVVVLDVSGEGSLLPHSPLNEDPYSTSHGIMQKLMNDLIWLDDSLPALRTYDVIRALDFVEGLAGADKTGIRVYAHGKLGLAAQLAALLDRRIQHLEVNAGMESIAKMVASRYYDANQALTVVLPGMLRYFDVPDIELWVRQRFEGSDESR